MIHVDPPEKTDDQEDDAHDQVEDVPKWVAVNQLRLELIELILLLQISKLQPELVR